MVLASCEHSQCDFKELIFFTKCFVAILYFDRNLFCILGIEMVLASCEQRQCAFEKPVLRTLTFYKIAF